VDVSRNLQTLVIDDSDNDVLLLARALRRGGFAATCVRVDTAEAMRAALDQQSFDLVFLAETMPQFSGLAALDVLRERELYLPCILLATWLSESEIAKVLRAGAHDFVSKQDLSRLATVVGRLTREAAQQAQRRAEASRRESEARYVLVVSREVQKLSKSPEYRWFGPGRPLLLPMAHVPDFLPAPIVEVWEGLLAIPILGSLDESRAALFLHTVLDAVSRARCQQVIVDLTGAPGVDPSTADRLVRLLRAVQLLGAQGIVVGSPSLLTHALDPALDPALGSSDKLRPAIRQVATLWDALVFLLRQNAGRLPSLLS
jgi:CheY-like chemotaxis protein